MADAEQMMKENGGDDTDEDSVQVKLTHKEALMAAFTLQKYIADINEPFVHKPEGNLANFKWQTWMEDVS